jgi:hypothetical protein
MHATTFIKEVEPKAEAIIIITFTVSYAKFMCGEPKFIFRIE